MTRQHEDCFDVFSGDRLSVKSSAIGFLCRSKFNKTKHQG